MKIMIWMMTMILMTTSGIEARQCSNPYCMMCNRNHLCQEHGMCITSTITYQQYTDLHTQAHTPKFQPTPQPVVEYMLSLLNLSDGDMLYDVGCGDGRIVKTAVQKYKCKALGIEINPQTAALARQNIAGLSRVKIQTADATKLDLSRANVVTMYLDQELVNKIVPKLRGAERIVSYNHPIPRSGTKKILFNGKHIIYLWEVSDETD